MGFPIVSEMGMHSMHGMHIMKLHCKEVWWSYGREVNRIVLGWFVVTVLQRSTTSFNSLHRGDVAEEELGRGFSYWECRNGLVVVVVVRNMHAAMYVAYMV